MTATYQHTLSSDNSTNFLGKFSCLIRDENGGTATKTLALNGVCVDVEEMLQEYPVPDIIGYGTVV